MEFGVKGIGFKRPYMEVSGACAGCGEAPYYRLVSQLFGKDMLVANATGCSSIYCGSTPLTPFVNDEGKNGPAWANSLFEDNAEYGFGMRIASDQKMSRICEILKDQDGVTEELTRETTFEEAGIDSLATVEAVMACEDEFGIEIDSEANPKTIGEFVDMVDKLIAEKA